VVGEAPEAPEFPGSQPLIPGEVMEALQQRDLVLVIGPGVSAQSGLPTSSALWLGVLERHAGRMAPSRAEGLRALIVRGDIDSAIELMVSLLERDAVVEALRVELMAAGPSRLHGLLAGLPVPVVLDTTWDELMPEALAHSKPRVFGPGRHEGISEALRGGEVAVIKPFGSLRQAETVVLTRGDYRRLLAQAPELERSIAALFSTRTLLFLGFSLRGLEQFLATLPPQLESTGRSHFAVVPAGPELDLWQAGLGRRYGVNLVGFHPSADYRELVQTATLLAGSVQSAPGSSAERTAMLSASRLTYLKLDSIGIFRELRFEFSPGWTRWRWQAMTRARGRPPGGCCAPVSPAGRWSWAAATPRSSRSWSPTERPSA
jgi:hypothetical protein